jgi:hypothetical protein
MPVLGATADCSPYFVALLWRFRIVLGKLVRAVFALYGLPSLSLPQANLLRAAEAHAARPEDEGRPMVQVARRSSSQRCARIAGCLQASSASMSDASPCSYGGLRFVFAGSYVESEQTALVIGPLTLENLKSGGPSAPLPWQKVPAHKRLRSLHFEK